MLVPFLHEIGGMERQAIQLAQTLREQGVEVVIITGLYLEDYFKGRRPGLRWKDSVAGVPVYRVPVTRLAWRLRLIAFACFALILLATKLRRFQLIHAHQLISTGLAGAIIGWLLRRSVIVKIASGGYVGDLVTLRRAFFGRPPIKFLGQRLDLIICLTSQIRTELLAVGFPAEKMTVIPNGVDTTNFCPTSDQNRDRLRDKLGLPDQSKLVLFIGGLKPKKRAAFLLSAWHVVQQEKVNAHLLFIGKGPLRPELEAQCKHLGVEKTVSFVGLVDNVDQYLRTGDLFVLPSLGEGLSNALLEAMATGLTVITTDTPGNRDVITHEKNGLLCPVEDELKLAEQLITVCTDDAKAKRLGKAALATARENLSLQTIAGRYIELYSTLLDESDDKFR